MGLFNFFKSKNKKENLGLSKKEYERIKKEAVEEALDISYDTYKKQIEEGRKKLNKIK